MNLEKYQKAIEEAAKWGAIVAYASMLKEALEFCGVSTDFESIWNELDAKIRASYNMQELVRKYGDELDVLGDIQTNVVKKFTDIYLSHEEKRAAKAWPILPDLDEELNDED